MKSSVARVVVSLQLLVVTAFASNSVVNMSHYDLMRVDFVAMKNEGVVGVIHEASFPRRQRDWRYAERQVAATRAVRGRSSLSLAIRLSGTTAMVVAAASPLPCRSGVTNAQNGP